MDVRMNRSWWSLRPGLGIVPIVTGIDKYQLAANREMYFIPLAPDCCTSGPGPSCIYLQGKDRCGIGSTYAISAPCGVRRMVCMGVSPPNLISSMEIPGCCSARAPDIAGQELTPKESPWEQVPRSS